MSSAAGTEPGDCDPRRWIGRTQTRCDRFDRGRANALCASLAQAGDEPCDLRDGDPLPPLAHWLYFWEVATPDRLGADGHPRSGDLLWPGGTPVDLPRRMWAGGRLRFLRPLRIGGAVSRVSTILAVEAKAGRSGQLLFVTVEHRLSDAQGEALIEEQDIVYREPASVPAAPPAAPLSAAWSERRRCDAVLLFRYSALTMNGHRIHYDRDYAREVEAYPGLVVHGPLQATLLLGLATRRAGRPCHAFCYRGLSPATDQAAVTLCGEPAGDAAELWVEQRGVRCMRALAQFEGAATVAERGMSGGISLGRLAGARSWLFVPGSRPERFDKAQASGADGIILDLEDAVAPAHKPAAREAVARFLRARAASPSGEYPAIAVRINPLGTMLGLEDLAGLGRLCGPVQALLLPKLEQPGAVRVAADGLADAGVATALLGLIESARGVTALPFLVDADPRLAGFMFGAADYAADLGQTASAVRAEHARAAIVNAGLSRPCGVAIDSPSFALDDPDGLLAAAREARALGFTGKAAIHPSQVATIARAFRPEAAETARAQRILDAAAGGVGALDGEMVDAAMARWARRVLGGA